MLLRKPLPLWFNVSLLAVTVGMIPLASQLSRRPVPPPRTLSELAERLSQSTPPLHVVRYYTDTPESPIWVCDQPRHRQQLGQGLLRDPERAKKGEWQGTVYCERVFESWLIEDEFIHDYWGEYGMRIGSLVFFGDPELLQRIRAKISD